MVIIVSSRLGLGRVAENSNNPLSVDKVLLSELVVDFNYLALRKTTARYCQKPKITLVVRAKEGFVRKTVPF